MPDSVFPITFTDKIDSPDLVAYFAQFPETSYLSAAQINIIKAALNELNLRVSEGLPIDDAIVNGVTDRAPSQNAVFDGLASKLDASAYNDRFKGVHLTEAALNIAHPTANAGDRAQVNEVGATEVVNYSWDAESEIWVITGSVSGGPANTDELGEGSSNLYFTTARVLATVLTGLSTSTGGAIVSTDTLLQAFGKLQNQINELNSDVFNNHINYTIGTGGTGRVNVGHASTGTFNAGTQTGGKTDYGITLIKNTTSAVLGSQANYNQLIPNIITTGFSKIKLIHQSFFGIASATTPTSSRCLNGYTTLSLKNMGNIEPSTAAVFAFCNDSADTNLQLAWRNSSNVVTKIDLGSNFPARYADGEHFYKCIFKFLGNNQAIAYLKDIETGLSWNSGVISGVERIEPNGVQYVNHINNNTTAEAVDIYWFGQITKYTYDI